MDMTEFNEKVKPVADATTITFDVRHLGDQQGDAIDSYLHARLMHMGTTGIGTTNKRVVLLCEATALLPATTENWLRNLNARGQVTEIQRA